MPSLNSELLQAFYKTSPMREGIINWYPFDRSASVIESGGGVLLELLRSCCGTVEELREEYQGERNFDYVVAIDPGEITVERLKRFRSLLHEHGRLLLAFENPYGLQYLSGKRNPHTGLPYVFQKGESKAEISNRLLKAGFTGQKWYYPFTNHYFAREIYSENYLPNEFLNHRGSIFVEDDCTKTFDERDLWKEVIRNGAFEFLCNSYLVEARISAKDAACDVDYAAVTAYREKDRAFITTAHNNGIVKKRPIFEEGKQKIESIAAIHNELRKLSVNILPLSVETNSLKMERINLPTLWDYWTRKLIDGELREDELFSHYDKLHNEIKKTFLSGKAYWEMVPANCFYDKKCDEIILFDQEHYWDDVDPDVVMIRAIHALIFSEEFQRHLQTKEWIDKLKLRYRLVDKWDELAEIASVKAHEFVFNSVHTEPIGKIVSQVLWHMDELYAERKKESQRYKKMCAVAEKLKSMSIDCAMIYGYGQRGRMLRYVLEEYGITVSCIIDRSLPIVRGTPLFSTIEEIPTDIVADIIILTPLKGTEEVAANIKQKTSCRVAAIEELLNG